MAYTPKLTQTKSGVLRRIAWALQIPMTVAIEEVVDYVSRIMDRKKVCDACLDASFCDRCSFNKGR